MAFEQAWPALNDVMLRLLREIAVNPDYRNPDLFTDWQGVVDGVAGNPLVRELRGRKLIVFFGVSFEQVRHAAAIAARGDYTPVLLHMVGDHVAQHYARVFPAVIEARREWELLAMVQALRPLAVTTTIPSGPLNYRVIATLMAELHGLRVAPFIYDFIPPSSMIRSPMHMLSRRLVMNCGGFLSWHSPVDEVQGGCWTPIATIFNQPPKQQAPRSLAYVGVLSCHTVEHNVLLLAGSFADQGYTLDVFDARNDADLSLLDKPGLTYHRRVPEFDLLDQLGGFRFGLCTPYIKQDHPRSPGPGRRWASRQYGSDGDWCNRNGVPGKMLMYLEAGIIPIVHAETEYAARFVEHFDIGYVFTDDDYFDMDRALARKSPERLRANLLRLRECEINWKHHISNVIDYLVGPKRQVYFPE